MTGAREVAYETLRAVHESDAYANLLLPAAIERAGLSAGDAALATELTYGTLRRRGTYDAIIGIAADRAPSSIDPEILDALRLGVGLPRGALREGRARRRRVHQRRAAARVAGHPR